jgi:hypothetical protein
MECAQLRSTFAMLSLCSTKYVEVPVNFFVLTISFSILMKLKWIDSFGCEAKRHASYTRSMTARQRSGLASWELRTYRIPVPNLLFCIRCINRRCVAWAIEGLVK